MLFSHIRDVLSAFVSGASLISLAACVAAPGVTSRDLIDQTPESGLPNESGGQSARLLSAFFGLDNALPRIANMICLGGAERDGMPVIFSTEIDPQTLQAGDFEVVTRSGKQGSMHCASFLPATDAGELRTVLLVGEFGTADRDPPIRVRVKGNVHSQDGRLNFQGTEVDVTPLANGPTIVLAELVTNFDQSASMSRQRTRGTTCPDKGVEQVLRVVWAGGVTLDGGEEPGQDVGALYKVTVEATDGVERQVVPVALADLGDGDNNHLLCLGTMDGAISVSFPKGVLVDPNGDLNPVTVSDVAPPS